MDKWIFISDSESELSNILIEKYISEGYKILTSTASPLNSKDKEDVNSDIVYFNWNKRSAISTKNLSLNISAAKYNIEKIIINYTPENSKKEIHEESLGSIENFIDNNIKAYTILTKEIISAFYNKEVKLSYIANKKKEPSSYTEMLGTAAITALINYLFNTYKQEKICVNAFISEDPSSTDLFSSFIFKTMETDSKKSKNKILTYQEKKSLFSSF